MFTADAHFEVLTGAASVFGAEFDELPHAGLVEGLEGIVFEDALFDVFAQEFAGVIARVTISHLREIIGAKREKFCVFGNFSGCEGSAGNFDHGADQIRDALASFVFYCAGHAICHDFEFGKFFDHAHKRNHDFGNGFGSHICGGFQDGTHLHFVNFWIGDAQPTTAMPEHGIEFVEGFDLVLNHAQRGIEPPCHFLLLVALVWEKLVQGWIEQANGYGQVRHRIENAFKIAALNGQQLFEGATAAFFIIGEDHLAHDIDAVAFKEHVLCAAQANAFGAKLARGSRIVWRVRIGAHIECANLICPAHQGGKITRKFRLLCGNLAEHDFTRRTINRDPVAAFDNRIANGELVFCVVDDQIAATRYAAFAHTASNHRSVRGHAPACGENALCSVHAADVFGRGFEAHQQDLLALFCGFFGFFCEKDDLSRRCPGRSGQSLGQHIAFSRGIEGGVQELIELFWFHAQHGFSPGNQSFFDHVNSNLDGGGGGAFATSGLQHPEFALLHGKFDVLHVSIVLFESLIDAFEGLIGFGKSARQAIYGFGRANTRDHVFALCIGEKFAVKYVFTCGGVARKCNACGAVIAHVAIDHGLYVDRRSPISGDIVQTSIDDGAIRLPGAKYCANTTPELLNGIGGEILSRACFYNVFEHIDEGFEVLYGHVEIIFDAVFFFYFVDGGFKGVYFEASSSHAHYHIAIGLDEATIRVPSKTRIVASGYETFCDFIVETEVEYGFHHAGHGDARTRAHGKEQWVCRIAEFATHHIFELGNVVHDLFFKCFGILFVVIVIIRANFGGDGKSGGHGNAKARHFCEVRAFATEQIAHFCSAFGFAIAKEIDIFFFLFCFRHCVLQKGSNRGTTVCPGHFVAKNIIGQKNEQGFC